MTSHEPGSPTTPPRPAGPAANLGIDFGTTRTVVALADRGNYPVVDFQDPDGDFQPYYPSLTAILDGRLVHGFEALEAAREGAPLVRSVKRELADPSLTLGSAIRVDGHRVGLLELVTSYLASLRHALLTASTLERGGLEVGQVVVGVPAHATTAQRLFTLEGFQRAGFCVGSMINEPSAAGFEYTHRQRRTVTSRRNRVLVYDLGGGTFDASLVDVHDAHHEVLGSSGLNHLGGDDFDRVLLGLVLQRAGTSVDELHPEVVADLLVQCTDAKESLSAQTRRVAVELNGADVNVPVADFFEAAAPLVEQSMVTMQDLVSGLDAVESEIAGIYLVGGSSSLPLVPRVLRERFGRRVHRSQYPAASTAIGLAIAADPDSGFQLTDRLSRGVGVFREREGGREVGFDPVLSPHQVVSSTEEVVVSRRYRAAHNIGWFRFVEYGRVDELGQPVGDLSPRAELWFPFAEHLQWGAELRGMPVEHIDDGPLVEEAYTIDAHGIVSVRVTSLDTGFTLQLDLG